MQNEIDIVRDISERFSRAKIPFMLTGSMAMNFYAEPRMTKDIDVVVELSVEDANKVIGLFSDDYYLSPEAVSSSILSRSMFNLIHNETIIKVDCIVKKVTEYRKMEFERRQEIQVSDFKTWIVSKEDLIISKLEWAKDSRSETQLGDVRNLLNTSFDQNYLHNWTEKLGLNNLFEECLHE